ncbi:MAG TPA: zinc ribbon domain-containing protein [Xanthomonadaceae bacterium]|nr:zinc ribbon domain-containing protein [Xanthomonadaceae bacterium]
MNDMIQFVANYDDLSTDRGWQFRFHCDKCHNGFMSAYEASTLGTAASLLHAAGSVFGGILGSAGNSAYEIQRTIGGTGHDAALRKAVAEGKEHFKQCTRCGKWVCPEVCWNASAGLCDGCAPKEQEELAAQKAQAEAEQIATHARAQDYTAGLDFSKGGMVACSKCGAQMSAGTRFCAECGTPNIAATAAIAQPKFCTSCGAKIEPGAKFCPGCGAKA